MVEQWASIKISDLDFYLNRTRLKNFRNKLRRVILAKLWPILKQEKGFQCGIWVLWVEIRLLKCPICPSIFKYPRIVHLGVRTLEISSNPQFTQYWGQFLCPSTRKGFLGGIWVLWVEIHLLKWPICPSIFKCPIVPIGVRTLEISSYRQFNIEANSCAAALLGDIWVLWVEIRLQQCLICPSIFKCPRTAHFGVRTLEIRSNTQLVQYWHQFLCPSMRKGFLLGIYFLWVLIRRNAFLKTHFDAEDPNANVILVYKVGVTTATH